VARFYIGLANHIKILKAPELEKFVTSFTKKTPINEYLIFYVKDSKKLVGKIKKDASKYQINNTHKLKYCLIF